MFNRKKRRKLFFTFDNVFFPVTFIPRLRRKIKNWNSWTLSSICVNQNMFVFFLVNFLFLLTSFIFALCYDSEEVCFLSLFCEWHENILRNSWRGKTETHENVYWVLLVYREWIMQKAKVIVNKAISLSWGETWDLDYSELFKLEQIVNGGD